MMSGLLVVSQSQLSVCSSFKQGRPRITGPGSHGAGAVLVWCGRAGGSLASANVKTITIQMEAFFGGCNNMTPIKGELG